MTSGQKARPSVAAGERLRELGRPWQTHPTHLTQTFSRFTLAGAAILFSRDYVSRGVTCLRTCKIKFDSPAATGQKDADFA